MSITVETLDLLARISVERMFYGLVEGTVLALVVGFVLWFLPRRNSSTRFMIWFAVLIFMLLLPFFGHSWPTAAMSASPASPAPALITVSSSIALYIFLAWAVVAAALLARVAAGLWQIRRLRRSCTEINQETLPPQVREILEGTRKTRPVALCVSEQIQIPTALGFLKPAVVLPAWLMYELPPAELKQVVLHELTHLRRRDDWTNLAQKIVKALLFFHPLVWWVEQRISLEREMACDDAVLAQTTCARDYALCLTRMAEKSFARRHMALAQAAVDRMRQLSLRVTQILDANRPKTDRLWKPAVPLVATAAMVCVFSAGHSPELVRFADKPAPAAMAATQHDVPVQLPVKPVAAAMHGKSLPLQPHLVLASVKEPVRRRAARHQARSAKSVQMQRPVLVRAKASVPASDAAIRDAKASIPAEDYVMRQQAVFLTVTDSGQAVWQVRTWVVRFRMPAKQIKDQTPRKST